MPVDEKAVVKERVLTARIIERVRRNNIAASDLGIEIATSYRVKRKKKQQV